MTDSMGYRWHLRPGLFLTVRFLRSHRVPVETIPLERLPQLSKRMIRWALRVYPGFLDRADPTFPIIIAGKGRVRITLDGRHRISKALWTSLASLPTVHVPLGYALELLIPGIFEIEWLFLFVRGELRRAGRHPGAVH